MSKTVAASFSWRKKEENMLLLRLRQVSLCLVWVVLCGVNVGGFSGDAFWRKGKNSRGGVVARAFLTTW